MRLNRLIARCILCAVLAAPLGAQQPMGGMMGGMSRRMNGNTPTAAAAAALLQRTDALLARTNALMSGASDAAAPNASAPDAAAPMTMMDHANHDPVRAMAVELHHVAIGLQGMARRLGTAPVADTQPSGGMSDTRGALYKHAMVMVAELDKSLQSLEHGQGGHAMARTP